MSRYVQWCPSCGATIPPRQIPIWQANFFACASCGAPLRLSSKNQWQYLIASLVVSPVVSFLLGFRGLELIIGSVVGFLFLYLFILPFMLGFADPARVELRPPTDLPIRFPDGPRDQGQAS